MLSMTRSRMRTAVSGVAAGALAVTALAFTGAPARAADTPTVDAAVSFADGIDVTVDGAGFNPASRPGAMGVYVAIAEKQDITTSPETVDFFSQAWVMPMQFTDGAFTTNLEVDPADVTEGTDYAVYTWTAHGNPAPGDSQFTETDVQLTETDEVAAEPSVTSTVVKASPATGLDLRVRGADFTAEPTGVYVGVAPANAEIDWTDSSTQGAFVGVNWVAANQFNADKTTFSTVINVPAKKLKSGTKYVIHTARAHGLPDRSQDTVTPVGVPFAKLTPKKVKPGIKVNKVPTTKKKGAITVGVKTVKGWKAASGKVTVALKKGKATKRANGKLNKAGKVKIKLPKLKKGKWKVIVKYNGDKQYKTSKNDRKIKVRK